MNNTLFMSPLPKRSGFKPNISSSGPHAQLSDQSSPELWGRLIFESIAMEHVVEGRSSVSPLTSRALLFDDISAIISPETSLSPTEPLEPVHIHGFHDTSIHACLPIKRVLEVCLTGWGESHAHADHETEIMIYGPRNEEELEVVLGLIRESLNFARKNN